MRSGQVGMRRWFGVVLGVVILLFTGCDKCKDMNCQNDGVCNKGICECPVGYRGELCETQRTPDAIVIRKVEFRNVGKWVYRRWDSELGSDSLPDVFLGMHLGIDNSLWHYTEDVRLNSNANEFVFEDGFPVEIDDFYRAIRFSLCDLDESGSYQEIYWANIAVYWHKNGLPESVRFPFDGGTEIEVWVEYVFDY